MSRPRVVHLTTVHHPSDPRIFWKQAVSLRQAGFEVFLVAPHSRRETVEGVDIVPLPQPAGRYRRVFLQRRAYRIARSLQAALYHVHDPELIPLAYTLKRATGARIVYDLHENNFVQRSLERYLAARLEWWCFGWADHLVLAEESYEALLPDRTPRTVILNFFRPFGPAAPGKRARTSSAFRLLAAGVQAADRGLDALLDLAATARAQALPWRLTLAGICHVARDRRAAERRIAREHLQHVVERVGWDAYVPWPLLTPHYAGADVGLALFEKNPNYEASIPTKFYEYLYYGLPILCTDFPLWRRFVARHGCGAVVPPGDAARAFAALKAWYDDPARYAQLSRAASGAASGYLWPAMEARLIGLYEALLSE